MKTVAVDSDLPTRLRTRNKQIKEAKRIAKDYFHEPVKRTWDPPMQGFFSRTWFVKMESGREHVIQFKVEPLPMEDFVKAHDILGDVVPRIEQVNDTACAEVDVYVYAMTLMPGQQWVRLVNDTNRICVTACESLGRILARGSVSENSASVVESEIVPKLKLLERSEDSRVLPFQDKIRDMLRDIDILKSLPLYIAHADLNQVNILLQDDGHVSGIVDWEGLSLLPFGMGFSRIHDLAGVYENGVFRTPAYFEDSEEGFWRELLDGLSPSVQAIVQQRLAAVQLAVLVGTLLENLDAEHGFNPVGLASLPKHLTSRIPPLRQKGESAYEL